MSEDFWKFTLAQISTIVVVICGVISLWIKLRSQGDKIEEIHKTTNGMSDALRAVSRKEGHAEGVEDERARALAVEEKKVHPS